MLQVGTDQVVKYIFDVYVAYVAYYKIIFFALFGKIV